MLKREECKGKNGNEGKQVEERKKTSAGEEWGRDQMKGKKRGGMEREGERKQQYEKGWQEMKAEEEKIK